MGETAKRYLVSPVLGALFGVAWWREFGYLTTLDEYDIPEEFAILVFGPVVTWLVGWFLLARLGIVKPGATAATGVALSVVFVYVAATQLYTGSLWLIPMGAVLFLIAAMLIGQRPVD